MSNRSIQLYTYILRLYPTEFSKEYGEEMKFVFKEKLKEHHNTIINFWLMTLSDVGSSLIKEHISSLRKKQFMKTQRQELLTQNKVFGYIAVGTMLLLLIPFINMQMGGSFNWDLFDFVVMGILIFGMASIFVIAARALKTKQQRIIAAVIAFFAFVYLWAELAVGIFTNMGS